MTSGHYSAAAVLLAGGMPSMARGEDLGAEAAGQTAAAACRSKVRSGRPVHDLDAGYFES